MIEIEKQLGILASIASTYPEASEEYKAVELASHALTFVWHRQVRENFREYLNNVGRELTEQEQEHLRFMGINENEDGLETEEMPNT